MGNVEESRHGAAQRSLARLQWLCCHRAGGTRGTQQGTALLGCDSATASPGQLGNEVLALTAEAPNPSWLLCWCEISINIPHRIPSVGFHQVEQSRRLVLDFPPFPRTPCIPKKFNSRRKKARSSLDVKSGLALAMKIWVAGNLGLWNNPCPEAELELQGCIQICPIPCGSVQGAFCPAPGTGDSCQV